MEMNRGVVIACVFLAALAVVMGFIRLAPSDADLWHKMPRYASDTDFDGAVFRIRTTGPDGLERFDAVALASPRTEVLTGSVAAGMVTYITRSPVFGFPDYTTVQQVEDDIKVFARLRFGGSDFGVNRKRVTGWLAQMNSADPDQDQD